MSKAAFSYSRLTSLETCPRKFHALNIAKSHKEEPNEHTDYGTQLHLAFADYFKKGKPLPLHLRQHESRLAAIKAAPGEFLVEQKLAINQNLAGTDWFATDVYCRVIADLTIMNGPVGIIWDWKTGRLYNDFTQLKLTGAVMFLLAPELQTLKLAYFWTKSKQVTHDTLHRKDMASVWASLAPRLARYQAAFDKQEFPPRPNPFCKGCVITHCQYWAPRR